MTELAHKLLLYIDSAQSQTREADKQGLYFQPSQGNAENYFLSSELNFATLDKCSGKQNDFATVWKMLLEDPNVKLKDLPDKMEIGYFVTLRWKDENGKTLGGKTVQLSNKAEFDELRKMVIAAGGKK